jgi:hypothetical protein
MARLDTTAEVIEALGGIPSLAELADASITGVYNWRANDRFPADTYLLIQNELWELHGQTAPDRLWPMRQPKRSK